MTRAAVAAGDTSFDVALSAADRDLLVRAETLLASGQAADAHTLLGAAEQRLAGNPYFDYLLGVAALDSGRTSEAIFSLRRAIAVEPRYAGARMELARAYYETGNTGLARPLFVALLDENPPPGVRAVIERYIDSIDTAPASPPGSLDAWVETFVGHDSNANGSTSNQQFLGFMLNPENLETASPFAEVGAGLSWVAPQSTRLTWLANGRIAHRANPDASFIDSTILSGYGGGSWQRGEYFGRVGVDGYAAWRDGESNESYAGVDLLFGRKLGDTWDLTLGLRAGADRFDGTLEVMDVDRFLYALGIAKRYSATSRLAVFALGGRDDETRAGSPYGNSKAGLRASFSSGLGSASFLHVALGRLAVDYDGLFFGLAREDTQTTAALSVEFRDVLTDGLTVMPMLRYVDNESDLPLYEYDRAEIGLLVRWMPQ